MSNVLLFLGGTHHDFDGFARVMSPVLEGAGHTVESTFDPDRLLRLGEDRVGVLLQYTGLGDSRQDDILGRELTTEQTTSLVRWVRAGGGLVSVHGATVISQDNPELSRLHGGRFLSHPPRFSFCVYPLARPHPITVGVEAFSVHDELYVQVCEQSVSVHMVAVDRGVCHPMVWSRGEGEGRVAHVALGHGPQVWGLEPFRRLLLQSVSWAAEGK